MGQVDGLADYPVRAVLGLGWGWLERSRSLIFGRRQLEMVLASYVARTTTNIGHTARSGRPHRSRPSH